MVRIRVRGLFESYSVTCLLESRTGTCICAALKTSFFRPFFSPVSRPPISSHSTPDAPLSFPNMFLVFPGSKSANKMKISPNLSQKKKTKQNKNAKQKQV